MSKISGIDYSLNSPAICIYEEQDDRRFDINLCTYHFISNDKKRRWGWSTDENLSNFIPHPPFENYLSETDRYDMISTWAIQLLQHCVHVFIEDYSYGSVGRVFNIAENMGLLKYKLWKARIPFTTTAPTVIKKFATGKGNANKVDMYESFVKETDIHFLEDFSKLTIPNPISDIVDSHFIAKWGVFNINNEK
jgi:hypothetical protein|tara:strand:- start:1053 stop:1631 length:579 start_codon:yes stop_codon:yes gene_type:complete